MALQLNDFAPDIRLPDQNGRIVDLASYKGLRVLVYFYPKDDTPGCTTEACGLRDHFPSFNGSGLAVLGISPDSVASHKKFVDKFGLTFPLLSDEKKDVVQRYGVWGLKKFLGKEYMGVSRTSFLIDPNGRIVKIYSKVKPEVHAAEVLADIKAFFVIEACQEFFVQQVFGQVLAQGAAGVEDIIRGGAFSFRGRIDQLEGSFLGKGPEPVQRRTAPAERAE